MKKFYLSLLIVAVALVGSAQSRLSLQNRSIIRSYQIENQLEQSSTDGTLRRVKRAEMTTIPALIKLSEGSTTEELEAEGVKVLGQRGDIVMAIVPIEAAERVASLRSVKKLDLSRKMNQHLDKARPSIGVDKIHTGTDLPKAYTGKGIITGIVDNGFDFNHVNFKDEDGNTRITHLTEFVMANNATSIDDIEVTNVPPSEIHNVITDNTETFHGSHTMGIMAGGYKGMGTFGYKKSAFEGGVYEMENPYYGVATESDLAISCGDLFDALIAFGVEGILEHAYKAQKPAVINLSLGSNVGTHDGRSTMGQYLELAGKEAIICVSAGNEGDLPIALNKTYTAEDNKVQSFLAAQNPVVYDNSGNPYYNLRYGQLEVYSNDSTAFNIKAIIYNRSRDKETWNMSGSALEDGEAVYTSTEGYASEGDLSHTNFDRAFEGYVGIGKMMDAATGRYYAMIDYYVFDNQETNKDGNYILGFVIEGKEGQRVDCFCDGKFTVIDNYNIAGYDDGMCNGSISDMACANNILVVGSYNTRDDWFSIDGYEYGLNAYKIGHVSPFSSYGTLIDGRTLPHVCAPGATIISSSNEEYLKSYGINNYNDALQGKVVHADKTDYWHQQVGTSMAAPLVAGSIALWLQADPSLTIDDVKEIIELTAVKDVNVTGFTGDPVQWGAGKFDAYAGLKEVIRRAEANGIEGVNVDAEKLLVKQMGLDCYNIFLAGADAMDVVVYNMMGQPVLKNQTSGDEIDINVSSLASGVYILSVNGNINQRILVK